MAKNRISRFDPLVTAASVTAGSGDLRSTSSLHSTTELGSHDRPVVSANYGQLINWLYGKGVQADSELLQILGSMGISIENMSGDQQADWNKQLLDQMFAQLSEEDARKYNQGVLAEQRLYDSPTNQLARLMAAGISRDKAIEMLSGSGGSGGSVAAGSPAAQAAGIPASQSDLNRVQAQTAIANTVFGGISAVSGLVSLGVSIPSAVAQATTMNIQNALSQKALIGLQSADAVMSALENAVQTGVLSTKDIDGFSNGTDALNYIQDHKDTNAFKGLYESGAFAQVYGTKLGREMFSQAWKNLRSSKDDGTILDNYIESQKLQNALSGLQAEQIGAEMEKLGAETSAINQGMVESLHRIAQIDTNIEVLNEQGKWIRVQAEHMPDVWDAEIDLSHANAGFALANAESVRVQTDINRDVFEINHAGVPILKQKYIDECEFAAYHASTLNSKEARDQYWQAWMLEAENAHAAAFLKVQFNNAVGNFSVEHPHTWKLMQGFKYTGGFDAVRAGAEAGITADAVAKGAKFLLTKTP